MKKAVASVLFALCLMLGAGGIFWLMKDPEPQPLTLEFQAVANGAQLAF